MTQPYGIAYERLSLGDLNALPIDTIRNFRLGQVYVRAQKASTGWKVLKRYGVPGTILSNYATEEGDCIHTGNQLLKEVTGYYPQTVNKAVKRLLREVWLEQTHEHTATTPRVFRLTIPEEFL